MPVTGRDRLGGDIGDGARGMHADAAAAKLAREPPASRRGKFRHDRLRITLRRQDERSHAIAAAPSVSTALNGAGEAGPGPNVSTAIKIESPMVGTFYRSPGPNDPPFVQEGDRVEVGQVLCILEAMKLFNEFKSEHAGTIRAVLAGNAEPVEYGQPLFELEP